MKKTSIPMIGVLAILLFLASCTADPRDDCCIAIDGRRDAPFTTTYLFQYKTGTFDIVSPGNLQGLLKIITEADILTLKNAASTSQLKKNGLISGLVQGLGGPAREVNLQVTDRAGNILSFTSGAKRNFFFNSLGRVPDFLVNRGTGDEGTFTLFNVPTGELFFQITAGGRGNGRITSIDSAVSIGQIDTLPVYPDFVEVLGVISNSSSADLITDGSTTFFGNANPVVANIEGLFILPPEEAIPTQGEFLLRLKAPKTASRETTLRFDTEINKVIGRAQAFDPLTANRLSIYSDERIQELATKAGIPLTASMAIIIGRARGVDGTGKNGVTVVPLDQAGNDLSFNNGSQRIFYFSGGAGESGGLTPSLTRTTSTGRFILFIDSCENASAISLHGFSTTVTDPVARDTGRAIALCQPGGIFEQDIVQINFPKEGAVSDPPIATIPMNGSVKTQTGDKVNNAEIQILGSSVLGSSASTLTDVNGGYRFDEGMPGEVSPLLANSIYTFRTALDENYIPTYQSVFSGAREGARELRLFTTAMRDHCLPSVNINFVGTAVGLGLLDPARGGLSVAGISFKVVQENGTEVGRVVYPGATSETSQTGEFIVCDLPGPGFYQVRASSREDSGALLLRNYADGVSLFDISVNKALPREVLVSGFVEHLLGPELNLATPVGDGVIRVHGLLGETNADASGGFSLSLASNGRYIMQVDKTGQLPSYNYHVETPVLIEKTTITPLKSVSREAVNQIATQMSVTQIAEQGLVAGKVVTRGLAKTGISLVQLSPDFFAMSSGFYDDDSHVDIISISSTGEFSVFLGDGLGGVQEKMSTCPSLGLPLQQVLQTDFDLNGRADLVAISGNSIFLFIGNDAGCFDAPEEITETLLQGKPKALSLADLDSNGFLDILVATDNFEPLIRLSNRGDATFEETKMEGSCGTNPVSVVARQGGSGLIDVIVADSVAGVCEITYDNTAEAAQPTKIMELPEAFDVSGLKTVRSAFLDSDGFPDVLVIHDQGGVAFLGEPPTDITVASIPFDVQFSFPDNFITTSTIVLDLSRDNRNDLLLGGPSGLLFFLGNGDGSFGLSRTILSTASPALSLADLNEDGKIDLIAPEGTNLSLFLGEDTPQENIKIEVRDADGLVVGDIAYLDEAGQFVPDAQQTTASGRFLTLNVPEGRTLVQVIEGGAGNNMITTFVDSLSYLHLNMNRIDPAKILLDGQVINPTSGPNAGIAVENIKITPLSTGLEALSLDVFDDPATEDIDEGRQGAFKLELGATSEYILKLDPQPF
ncbi:hypothetical protein MNBD_NITROSPIRAE01-2018 [hydrothermal vent metagenome]|uniref:Uncharacterized protein n=1 Tax=hydrothermal vent metagenome TaxID=652676 RepID=A0A3B1CY93_9ZZZZ